MNKVPPTAGEWYQTLSLRKQTLFNVLCRMIGDINALWLFGYWRYVNKKAKKS